MFCDFAPNPFLDLLRTDARIRGIHALGQDVCAWFLFGAEGVLDTYDAGIGDGRVGEEDGFEFGGSNLEAGDFDKFLANMFSTVK